MCRSWCRHRKPPLASCPSSRRSPSKKPRRMSRLFFTGPAMFMVRHTKLCPYCSSSARCRKTRRSLAASICSKVTCFSPIALSSCALFI